MKKSHVSRYSRYIATHVAGYLLDRSLHKNTLHKIANICMKAELLVVFLQVYQNDH